MSKDFAAIQQVKNLISNIGVKRIIRGSEITSLPAQTSEDATITLGVTIDPLKCQVRVWGTTYGAFTQESSLISVSPTSIDVRRANKHTSTFNVITYYEIIEYK